MLEVEVDQRYTALQVLEHPWVTVSTAWTPVPAVVIVSRELCFISSALCLDSHRMRGYVRTSISYQ